MPTPIISAALKDALNAFTVYDKDGRLLPHFIGVIDGEIQNPRPVAQAYGQVVRARLSDAQFFFERDMQKPLLEHGQGLDHLILRDKLGHYADKTERLRSMMRWLAPAFAVDDRDADRSAQLCKCDLLTEAVGEFPGFAGPYGAHLR